MEPARLSLFISFVGLLMNAYVLCGGLGTRLAEVHSGPKFLAPVGDTFFAELMFRWLSQWGIRTTYLLTGYLEDEINQYVSNNSTLLSQLGMRVVSLKEDRPLGTGGAIAKLKSMNVPNGWLFNGDTIVDVHCNKEPKTDFPITMLVSRPKENPAGRYGTFGQRKDGVLEFSKSVPYGPRDIGICYINFEQLDVSAYPEVFDLGALVADLTKCGRVKVVECDRPFLDIGVPKDLSSASEILRGFQFPKLPDALSS